MVDACEKLQGLQSEGLASRAIQHWDLAEVEGMMKYTQRKGLDLKAVHGELEKIGISLGATPAGQETVPRKRRCKSMPQIVDYYYRCTDLWKASEADVDQAWEERVAALHKKVVASDERRSKFNSVLSRGESSDGSVNVSNMLLGKRASSMRNQR